MRLAGRVAVVTGGGRGIGRAIALAFAREGADVCVAARSEAEIEAVAGEIRILGRRALAARCDVADPDSVEGTIAAAAAELGRIDLLVNNAGGSLGRGSVAESDPILWARVIQVNLLGTYYCSRAVLPHMVRVGGGKILNVGSGMGHEARPGNSAYSAAKAGVRMLTRCLAMEAWEQGIEVNEIVPGPVYTAATAARFDPSGLAPPPFAPSERVKLPDEVAALAVYLAALPGGGPTAQTFSLARRPL